MTFTGDDIHPHCVGFFELAVNVTNPTQTSYVEAVLGMVYFARYPKGSTGIAL